MKLENESRAMKSPWWLSTTAQTIKMKIAASKELKAMMADDGIDAIARFALS